MVFYIDNDPQIVVPDSLAFPSANRKKEVGRAELFRFAIILSPPSILHHSSSSIPSPCHLEHCLLMMWQ